ncbi:MAG: sigma-70 family RNA polymerase sigma factor [Lachnospiraceae bacterium]|nr:sigma-70 family RNA polymerase sigma factor [Lachnospiraceae bacterium]
MKDDEIVDLFWKRDENALVESQRVYGNYCMHIARNILFNEQDSEECFNSVLLAAWESIPPQKPQNLKTYLGRLARIISFDYVRRKNMKKRIPEEALTPIDELRDVFGSFDVESAVEEEELSHLISVFLRSCKEDERNIFVRRYWYYDSVNEICSRYGYGKSKVTVSLKRTRDKLVQYLMKGGYNL